MAKPSRTPPQEPDEELEESLLETFPASDATSGSSVLPPAARPEKNVEPDSGADRSA